MVNNRGVGFFVKICTAGFPKYHLQKNICFFFYFLTNLAKMLLNGENVYVAVHNK